MPYRRPLLAALTLVTLAAVTSCGGADGGGGGAGGGNATVVKLTARQPAAAATDKSIAANSITAAGFDIFTAVGADADPAANVIISPASIAIALAMLEPGATGDAQTQIRSLLRIDDPAPFHASINALVQGLESREPPTAFGNEPKKKLTIRVANAAYLQQGVVFEPPYLDAIGTNYGPTLNTVDFHAHPDAVGQEINKFVSTATNGKIPKLVSPGAIDPASVLTLINALYLQASWQTAFEPGGTAEHSFTLTDGSAAIVQLMRNTADSAARGDGWVAATKRYVGGLSAEFVLPDDGRFAEVAANVGQTFADIDDNRGTAGILGLPRFTTRFQVELGSALAALGVTAPFQENQLLGIANDPQLKVGQAIHETIMAMDESGTEAAAATAMMLAGAPAPVEPPIHVILDRPFFFRIFDELSGATLFVGRIMNPTV